MVFHKNNTTQHNTKQERAKKKSKIKQERARKNMILRAELFQEKKVKNDI
jgi:hypothetical protein